MRRKFTQKDLIGLKVIGDTGPKSIPIKLPDEVNGLDILNKRIFIAGEVRSSKNHRQLSIRTKKLKSGITKTVPVSMNSNAVNKYKDQTEMFYKLYARSFHNLIKDKEKPLLIQFQFIRTKRMKCDFANMVQLVQDMMKDHGWIPDDNEDEMLPIPHTPRSYEIGSSPGVWIKVL